ncbi:MAG TPA: GNAT family N-acetyltransferase [Spirochaetota bacterium]|nr:GNAT family N-acetyltransferase [Spirochaetota bacterium]
MEFNIIKSKLKTDSEREAFINLLNEYIEDKMGGGNPYNEKDRISKIIKDIMYFPTALIFFAADEVNYLGMAVTFLGYSTFNAKPLINIHDLIISKKYRNLGVGKKILENIIEYGKEAECCKITLEVRIDNEIANHLYKKMGFIESNPPMRFLHKSLNN